MRLYMPRCHTCGPLHAPMPLDAAIEACAGHRINHPNHKTNWTPIRTAKDKGENHGTEGTGNKRVR